MTGADHALTAAALLFVLLSGVNDGASLVAIGLRVPWVPPLVAVVGLVGAVVAAPLVVGTAVASTVATGLVTFGEGSGAGPLLGALGSALIVAGALARRGLPTSLTLALLGGIVGTGVGRGLPTAWGAVGLVLLAAAAAPVVGGVAGWGLGRVTALVPLRIETVIQVAGMYAVGFAMVALAYGANAGQNMLAVMVLSSSTTGPGGAPDADQLVVIGVVFGAGALLGLPKVARTLGSGIMVVRPVHAANAELAAAAALMGSTVMGLPVSVTQTATAALVGTGLSEGRGRIRWEQASRIIGAWVLTIPAAALLAAAVGRLSSLAA